MSVFYRRISGLVWHTLHHLSAYYLAPSIKMYESIPNRNYVSFKINKDMLVSRHKVFVDSFPDNIRKIHINSEINVEVLGKTWKEMYDCILLNCN